MRDICPDCEGDAWANEGDGFYCVYCGWPDREWYLYPEDDDAQMLCDGTCDTCNCAFWEDDDG